MWGGVVWDSGSSKVADKSYLLYLLLFFTWRLNGSHFLIEKHAVNARRGCFYSQKNRTASASTRARICRICMKFVAHEKNVLRYYSDDESRMSIRGVRERITGRIAAANYAERAQDCIRILIITHRGDSYPSDLEHFVTIIRLQCIHA